MKAVVVLGATSMLGREITRQLSNKGVEIISAGRHLDSDIVVNLGSSDAPTFRKSVQAEVLIHCASAFGGDDLDGVKQNLSVNMAGCAQVLDIVQHTGVRKIVYAGSLSSDQLVESGIPLGAYGFSKGEAERILQWGMTKIGGDFCSLRLTQLWDTEGACCTHQPWFGRIVAYASHGLTLKMPTADGPRNFMHVSDAAQLLIRAADSSLAGIRPVSFPVDTDLLEFARQANVVFDRGGSIEIDAAKKPFRKMYFPKDESVFDLLGFHPRISLEDGLTLIRNAGTAEAFGPLDVQ
ncbi:NAD-dependent epimerase/dehydratase family protein [Herminiimonas sp. NPDC097707]|uniref:NAD-dependent epimerase/dehydratase family protein n=1 Tax=Herminiimonas sp. NPDC097707 TaxID=3364007 RepID=UPI00383A7927